jgi:hypothetical protein
LDAPECARLGAFSKAEQRGWAGRAGRNRVHSVVTQEVNAIGAQKLNVHAVCERAASGQLLFLGLFTRPFALSLQKGFLR